MFKKWLLKLAKSTMKDLFTKLVKDEIIPAATGAIKTGNGKIDKKSKELVKAAIEQAVEPAIKKAIDSL